MSNYENLFKADKISYFCILHRTTKGNEIKSKTRISKCNARMVFIKEENKYYMDWDHSPYCRENNCPFVDKLSDINKEVDNYKNFRKCIYEYLDANPLVYYKNFKEKAHILYNRIKCKFEIKKNTLKNIYNTWKKTLNYSLNIQHWKTGKLKMALYL